MLTFSRYTVVGKLWNHYHEKQHVKPVFQETLDNYGLDYIDLYLIHCKSDIWAD